MARRTVTFYAGFGRDLTVDARLYSPSCGFMHIPVILAGAAAAGWICWRRYASSAASKVIITGSSWHKIWDYFRPLVGILS